jgi:hypothetical protein
VGFCAQQRAGAQKAAALKTAAAHTPELWTTGKADRLRVGDEFSGMGWDDSGKSISSKNCRRVTRLKGKFDGNRVA